MRSPINPQPASHRLTTETRPPSPPVFDLTSFDEGFASGADEVHGLSNVIGQPDRVDSIRSRRQSLTGMETPPRRAPSLPRTAELPQARRPATRHRALPSARESSPPTAPIMNLYGSPTAHLPAQNDRVHGFSEMVPAYEHHEMRNFWRPPSASAASYTPHTSTTLQGTGSIKQRDAAASTTTDIIGARNPRPASAARAEQVVPIDQRSTRADFGGGDIESLAAPAAQLPPTAPAAPMAAERPWYKKKKTWFFGFLVVGGAVGGGVGGYFGTRKSDDSSSDYTGSDGDIFSSASNAGLATSSSIVASAVRSAPYVTPSFSTASSPSRSAQPASSTAALLPWGSHGYAITQNKQLDTCANYDLSCDNPITDKWYVTQSGGSYNVVNHGNATQWTVDGQSGSAQLNFNIQTSTASNSDGCLFDTATTYSLNVGANSVSGTHTVVLKYNLDIQCIQTSGNFISQGASCQCRWGVSSSVIG